MKKQTFEEKIEKYAKDARTDLECLSSICKNSDMQIQRTISFVEADIQNILNLIWSSSDKRLSYKELENGFKKKVKDLQKNCKHENSVKLKGEYWLKGYPKNKGLRICTFCQKMLTDKKEAKNEKRK